MNVVRVTSSSGKKDKRNIRVMVSPGILIDAVYKTAVIIFQSIHLEGAL